MSGLPHGPLAATVAAWPALAFTVATVHAGALAEVATPSPLYPRPLPDVPAELNGHGHAAAELFAAEIDAGRVPGIRAIRSGLHVGQDKAAAVQAYLRVDSTVPSKPRAGCTRLGKHPRAGSISRRSEPSS